MSWKRPRSYYIHSDFFFLIATLNLPPFQYEVTTSCFPATLLCEGPGSISSLASLWVLGVGCLSSGLFSRLNSPPVPHPLLTIRVFQVELNYGWKYLCCQETTGYLFYQCVSSNLIHSIMKGVTDSTLSGILHSKFMSAFSRTWSLALFWKAMSTQNFGMSNTSQQPALCKTQQGCWQFGYFGIQKEKPVRREETTKEHSKGKFV